MKESLRQKIESYLVNLTLDMDKKQQEIESCLKRDSYALAGIAQYELIVMRRHKKELQKMLGY